MAQDREFFMYGFGKKCDPGLRNITAHYDNPNIMYSKLVTLNDEDIARLSPLCHGHINMLGHYSFTLAELVTKGHLRPLKEASEVENVA